MHRLLRERLDPADLQLARQAALAQVAAAKSEFTTASSERARYADLLARRFVSQAAFDARENAFRGARARLEQARAQSQISGTQASYGTLAADHDGVISAVLADAGQVVSAGQPVFRLARPEELEVAIAIPEGRLAEFKAARQIAVILWAQPDLAMKGEVRELAAAADPATRTYAARIRIADPAPTALRIGDLVALRIEGRNSLQVAMVRWFRNTLKRSGLEFGCELLSDSPEAAAPASEDAAPGTLQPVVVLPEDAAGGADTGSRE